MNPLRGCVSVFLLATNTLVACLPLYVMGLVRAVCRGRARKAVSGSMDRVIDVWVGVNRILFRTLGLTRIEVQWQDDARLARDRWYLVISNHQSWSDILVLQNSLWGRIPPLKFFTKRQLLWVPLIGLAMLLLGFPYVRRLNRRQIEANPDLVALDRHATLDACERFRDHPTTVLNFVEGTRFTPAKHQEQNARFDHLLNPKVGGMSYVVAGLGQRLHKLVDVTIAYPDGTPSFWELMQGRCPQVNVLVQCRDFPGELGEAADGDAIRQRLAPWIELLWREKDARLDGRHVVAN